MFSIKTIFINILSMSTIASIVFLLVLFARKCIKDKVNSEKSILLWIIFIIALIIPLNFESALSIKNYINKDETFVLSKSEEIGVNQSDKNNEIIFENDENKKINFTEMFSMVWFIITILLILKDACIYKTLDESESFEIPEKVLKNFEDYKKELNIEKDIKLVVQDKIKIPSLCGIFDTKILLTNEILNFSEIELKCIIVHELNHYKNNHHVLYLLFGIIEKIHWFNPLVNIAFKVIKQDLEIITDNKVLKANITKKEYCKTILKVVQTCSLSNVEMPSICSGKKEIERRIKQMKNSNSYTKTSIIILGIAILTVSLITVSLASDKVSNIDEINDEMVNNIFNKIDDEIENSMVEKVEYILPIENAKVSAMFGTRIHPITKEEMVHTGIDFAAEKGEKIKAVADGIVEIATFDVEKGNYVEIKHADGSISSYQHGSKILVDVGDEVNVGDEIMLVGATGMATGPHLHFEVRSSDGEYMDVNGMIE